FRPVVLPEPVVTKSQSIRKTPTAAPSDRRKSGHRGGKVSPQPAFPTIEFDERHQGQIGQAELRFAAPRLTPWVLCRADAGPTEALGRKPGPAGEFRELVFRVVAVPQNPPELAFV